MISPVLQSNPSTPEEMKKASLEVSKMFLRTMLKEVFNADEESAMFGDSHAGTIWKSLYVDTLADACAGHTGIEGIIETSIKNKQYPQSEQNIGGNINENF